MGISRIVRKGLLSQRIIGRRNMKIIRGWKMRRGQRVFRLVDFYFVWFWHFSWITSRISK